MYLSMYVCSNDVKCERLSPSFIVDVNKLMLCFVRLTLIRGERGVISYSVEGYKTKIPMSVGCVRDRDNISQYCIIEFCLACACKMEMYM